MNKSESNSLQNQVNNLYQRHFESGDSIVLGVSGGPDSMALLYLFQKLDIPVFVVHINYGLRAQESDADQQLVEDVCAMWGIECCSVKVDSSSAKNNFQNWAREFRYQVFADLKSERGSAGIATAHHKDDQLETVLFKMMRGGGISSWSGLTIWDGSFFRPFLNFTKSQIIEFCKSEAVPFRDDSSNQENTYARNALRSTVFPVFDKFIPGWKSNIVEVARKGSIANESFEFLSSVVVENESLSIEKLKLFSADLQQELIRRYLIKCTGVAPSKGLLENILRLLDAQTGKEILVNSQYNLLRERDELVLKSTIEDEKASTSISYEDVQNPVQKLGWEFSCNHVDRDSLLQVDSEKIKWPVILRKWKPGDFIIPLGMKGSQKVSDHLTNRKISSAKREETLILIDSGGTICAILYPEMAVNNEIGCISDHVKITKGTLKPLSIYKS